MTLPQVRNVISADAGHARLPARVLGAIATQQQASERLIGWFQLSVVSLFGALYIVSPKTFTAAAEFQPVPWTLALYFLFTLGRLLLAYRGRMPEALLYLSIIIDMALLFVLIWSFHLQYMQPPTFYLKAPTLLYVFIFIALRALRFEARFVLTAGFTAALGWSLLVVYAIWLSGGPDMVTRDYVRYMTTNSVLIGAEIDKIISILTVTAILAVAINRARALLTRSVVEGAAAGDLSRFFSPEIARQITAAEDQVAAGSGVAREAAIVNLDIRGFTTFAHDAPPAEVMAMLSDYQARMVPIIQQHGGAIDKFMGDGIMATFGAAVSTDSYAADALRAIDAAIAAADEWNRSLEADGRTPFRVGASLATGRVVFGAVGDASRLEYTVIGDAVNLSAKLEKHTKAEGVRALVDAASYDLALTQGYVPPMTHSRRDARLVEGVSVPIDLVVLAE